jgi:hypothetical protein
VSVSTSVYTGVLPLKGLESVVSVLFTCLLALSSTVVRVVALSLVAVALALLLSSTFVRVPRARQYESGLL